MLLPLLIQVWISIKTFCFFLVFFFSPADAQAHQEDNKETKENTQDSMRMRERKNSWDVIWVCE